MACARTPSMSSPADAGSVGRRDVAVLDDRAAPVGDVEVAVPHRALLKGVVAAATPSSASIWRTSGTASAQCRCVGDSPASSISVGVSTPATSRSRASQTASSARTRSSSRSALGRVTSIPVSSTRSSPTGATGSMSGCPPGPSCYPRRRPTPLGHRTNDALAERLRPLTTRSQPLPRVPHPATAVTSFRTRRQTTT